MAKIRQDTAVAVRDFAFVALRAAGGASANPPTNAMDFYNQQWFRFDDVYRTLFADPALSNRSRTELAGELWQLLDDVTGRPHEFKYGKAFKARLASFATGIVRETSAFEVSMQVEHLVVPADDITLGRATFIQLTETRAEAWGMSNPREQAGSSMLNHAVALVRVEAGSEERAVELASVEVDTALHLLRIALSSDAAGRPHPMDDLFLFRRTGWALLKSESADIGYRFERQFRPLEMDLASGPFKGKVPATALLGKRVSCLFDGTIAPGMAEALTRAYEWIGSSIARESYDDKVVDLCTALESVLALESDRLKAETIALRYPLVALHVGSTLVNANAILWLYRLRSRLVHGAARRIAGRFEYSATFETALHAVDSVLELAKRDASITSVNHLVKSLEGDPARIETVLSMVFSGQSRDDRLVTKRGREIIDAIKQTEAGAC